ncbi:DUF2202 domain-containing protein [Lutibacter flavus]|uniref:DUF2202 domain-containing protein n=1 Tax=Lutibacter flavus TaxID=691689 RepID=A0A238VQL3_9FLAO|nr:DUF2202 domain-containing protein [Lutibacter flavus]SNR36073.1 hypothetical protein SAMN04488111_0812 [Lutibacter flavus]
MKNTDSKKVLVLTSDEIEDLLYLRELEKLAKDVYIYSYDKYYSQIFNNIILSEEKHMNSVLNLLEKYNIEDPASEIIGEFKNQLIQEKYNHLIELSKISLLNAIIAGDIIEDYDTLDLIIKESRTTKYDLLNVYGSLKCGSRNHLRSFYNQTLLYDSIYIPEYISQEEFDLIVTSPYEK